MFAVCVYTLEWLSGEYGSLDDLTEVEYPRGQGTDIKQNNIDTSFSALLSPCEINKSTWTTSDSEVQQSRGIEPAELCRVLRADVVNKPNTPGFYWYTRRGLIL